MTFSKNSSSLNDFMDRVSNEFTESRSIFGIDVIVFVAVIIVGFILLGVVLKRRVRKTVRFSAAIVLIILVLVTINKVSLPDELGENQTTPVLQEPENIPEERNENDNSEQEGISDFGYDLRAFQETISPEEALTVLSSMALFAYNDSCTDTYEREDWKHWSDFDNDGINTRHEELIAESLSDVTMTATGRSVSEGLWDLVYTTGQTNSPGDLDAEHSTPLGLAHCIVDSMGLSLDENTREEFANHPTLTFVADKGENRARGAKSWADSPWGDGWFPSNRNMHCPWIAIQIQLRNEYGMGITSDEKSIAERVLSECI
jgi:hypothetical protein|tara:strand:- start:509 stop:1459 length:951 start_codon:yes stop_codon:yes gene_type:complete